jgi:hypothetical protein
MGVQLPFYVKNKHYFVSQVVLHKHRAPFVPVGCTVDLRSKRIVDDPLAEAPTAPATGDVRGVSVSEDGVDANVEFVEHVVFESGDGLDYSFGGLRLERVLQHILGLYVVAVVFVGGVHI